VWPILVHVMDQRVIEAGKCNCLQFLVALLYVPQRVAELMTSHL
jgi:hypothetical protein